MAFLSSDNMKINMHKHNVELQRTDYWYNHGMWPILVCFSPIKAMGTIKINFGHYVRNYPVSFVLRSMLSLFFFRFLGRISKFYNIIKTMGTTIKINFGHYVRNYTCYTSRCSAACLWQKRAQFEKKRHTDQNFGGYEKKRKFILAWRRWEVGGAKTSWKLLLRFVYVLVWNVQKNN